MSTKSTTLLIFLGIAAASILVLWQMLLPGYILTLDMVWVPQMHATWSTETFNNLYPVNTLIALLDIFIPSWIVQKILLISLFGLLFYIPYRFMSIIKERWARAFAGAVYALNPFVYSRILAGQWMVLIGYALLPLVLTTLLRLMEKRNNRAALYLGVVLALVGLFSVHFLYLSLLITLGWVASISIRQHSSAVLRYGALSVGACLIISSYWLIPGLLRHNPIEAQFNQIHYEAFAAASNGNTPVLLNTLALGGYWGEGTLWKYYFKWPQEQPLFWVAAGFIGMLIVYGTYRGIKRPQTRFAALLLIFTGLLAYITALGAADTPLRAFNLFLYNHVPLWNGLRDSQKITGILALVYATLAGMGAEGLIRRSRMLPYAYEAILPLLFILPAMFGLYEWGGFHKQLQPVWYPVEWQSAKAALAAIPNAKVLVLPWHGYLSLEFNNEIPVANPAAAFFGPQQIVESKSIDAGALHDSQVDPMYRALDALLSATTSPPKSALIQELAKVGITHVLFILNKNTSATPVWSDALSLTSATSSALRKYYFGNEALIGGNITLQKIKY